MKYLQHELLHSLNLSTHAVDPDLLRQALTHKSILAEKQTQHLSHNERLEYLGDAFIKASISEWLYRHLPDQDEGRLSQIRSYVVSDAALSKAAQRLELSKYLILGESERASGGTQRESILANVLESLCGALFLATGFQQTAQIILRLLEPELKLALAGQAEEVKNYKALLQEYVQGHFKTLPEYEVLDSEGPDHDRIFQVQVRLNQDILGQGQGRSKKKAEQDAAQHALSHLNLLQTDTEALIKDVDHLFEQAKPAKNWQKPQHLILAPSILSANFGNLAQALQQLHEAEVPWVHLDIMDGHFVPNLTIGAPVIRSLRPLSQAIFDAHLMVENPESMINDLVQVGCDRITVHYEACRHLDRVISQIIEAGAQAGVSLNPATPVECLEDILHKVQLVLVMSVNPGFGGQHFIKHSLQRIQRLKQMRAKQGLEKHVLIQVDGGINSHTLTDVIHAGADVVVIGSAIFEHANPSEMARHFQNELSCLELRG